MNKFKGRAGACRLACLIIVAAACSSLAATVTDSFAVPQNFLADGVAATIWEGLYTGAGGIPGGLNGGGPGQTLAADSAVTTAGRLTVQTKNTDWENAN